MTPKTASAVAAPRPDTKPESLPSRIVRRTHITPTGPTGTAMTTPTTTPFRKNAKSIGSGFQVAIRRRDGGEAQFQLRRLQHSAERAMLSANLGEIVDDCHRGCLSVRIYI